MGASAAFPAQPLDSDLTAIAALSTTAYGRALLALADAAALAALARATAANAKDSTNSSTWLTPASLLDVRACRALWTLTGADMNSTADQAFTKVGTFTNWSFIQIRARNASINLTTAQGGIYSAASKGGTTIVPSTQAYTVLSSPSFGVGLSAVSGVSAGLQSASALYLSLTTPQGSAATADFVVYGWVED